jgi:hypothetical protein
LGEMLVGPSTLSGPARSESNLARIANALGSPL